MNSHNAQTVIPLASFLAAIILAGLLIIASVAFAGDLPDPTLTPGATNPAVTQETIHSTICVIGWTKTIRPPEAYTNKLKLQQMRDRNLPGKPSDYEEDHEISLEIGGHPTDPKNLWPQAFAGQWGARIKDQLEDKLHRLVCAGTITLAQAQHDISTDWISAYHQYMK